MKPKIVLTETITPMGGATMWKREFRIMSLNDIENEVQEDLQSYANVGYNSFTFHRATGNISIRRIEVKTIDDVFMTDCYGLL